MYQTRRCRRCGVRGVFFLRKLRKWQADDFALGMFLAAFVIAVIAFGALLANNTLQPRLTPAACLISTGSTQRKAGAPTAVGAPASLGIYAILFEIKSMEQHFGSDRSELCGIGLADAHAAVVPVRWPTTYDVAQEHEFHFVQALGESHR